ncbi:bifunctional ornithine acetyltransferase/N-acetylglutamate synthase [Metabacillus sp. KIGAM252]|uniref:Arginine biosynthesis bifunctional protein ArgJ n=1 Tax=Metabacillus flavus TaxID=2823519 RepID=A0ABS5LCK3_9BACI|nr:bifunctional ornithine acetyltransferase/N-acetylglutamate synthase [Metabacillus flavus]MBS2968361.1 bifunctional ornithine acetyltransferase/N-acetylglutamate synthase [Metabacillus flavus]
MEASMTIEKHGSVVSPIGFSADGVHCGLRYSKKDLGVIFSEVPANAAAVYTQSHFQAAPLKVTQESIAAGKKIQALIVNSGNANACTGKQGLADAYQMRRACAERFGINEYLIAVASTGVIGERMNMEKILEGIPLLNPASTEENGHSFETAILTTDTGVKHTGAKLAIDGKEIWIGGAAKGSGMIHPNMATMLGFITTDAAIDPVHLQQLLSEATDTSFNQITVDGETSTNDMVLVLANGMAENDPLAPDHPQWGVFKNGFQEVCKDLAKQIAKDGEGATKLIEVQVNGAASVQEARETSKKIVGSSLVKTAVFGEDANWGRILGAIGHSRSSVNPDQTEIWLGGLCLFSSGEPQDFSEEQAAEYLKNNTIIIRVDLASGDAKATAWGCDLTYDYVKINASYRT